MTTTVWVQGPEGKGCYSSDDNDGGIGNDVDVDNLVSISIIIVIHNYFA